MLKCRNLTAMWLCILPVLFSLACNSHDPSSSDEPEADLSSPTVLSTVPLPEAVDVSVDVTLTARFSECIDTGSVDATSFVLSGGVSGSVTCSDSVLTFDPDQPLGYSTTYTASLTTDIIDRAGNALDSTYSWSFRTQRNLTPGVEWTVQTFPEGFSRELAQLAVTSGIYLAFDGHGDFIRSTSGVDWALGETGLAEDILTCFWIDTAFFGFGTSGGILVSNDGTTWETASAGPIAAMNCIADNGEIFIGCATTNNRIYSSTDFITWEECAQLGTGEIGQGVVWTGELFVIAGLSGPGGTGVVYSSEDGITWTLHYSEAQSQLYDVALSNDLIVCVGENGTIISSPDGIEWTEQESGTTENLFAVIWDGGNFMAVGSQTLVLSSTNGASWNTLYTDEDYAALMDIVWVDNMYIAVGLGAVFTSP